MAISPRRPTHPIASAWLGIFCALLASALCLACREDDPYREAIMLQSRGQYRASIEPLRELLEERGDDPEINYMYGRALTVTGQEGLGEWALRKAAEDPEWLIPAGTQLAANALENSNFDSAIEMATRVLEAAPDNADVLLIRAQARARSRMHSEEAIADADRLLEIDPNDTNAMEPRILALLTLDRIDEAEADIEKLGRMIEANEDASDWIRGWHCATTALFASDSGNDDLAHERWNDCVARFPGHANVVGNAIQFFDDQGEYDRSIEIMRAALEVEPQSLDYRRRLALRLRYAGKPDEAEEVLLAGTELGGPAERSAAFQALAKHHQDMGNDDAAVAAMREAIELAREVGAAPAQLLFDYADALVLQGDYDGALAVVDEMTVSPHQEMIRARIAQEQGDHLAALDHYEKAFTLWPDNPWARYLAARSAEATGQFDRAIELYRYSIRIQADATDARFRLADLLTALGEVSEASAILTLQITKTPLGIDGQLLALTLNAWGGEQARVARGLQDLQQRGPAMLSRAIAAAAEGVKRRHGAETAAEMLERNGVFPLVVADPGRADALRMLIELRHATKTLDRIEAPIRAAVEQRPDAASLHAALALWLELSEAPEHEVRAALDEALRLDADQADALAAMGRLSMQEDPARALELFDRAAAARPEEERFKMDAVRALLALGERGQAMDRLAALLEAHPHSARAAIQLSRLQIETGSITAETEALAERAVRFRGGLPALELLAQIYRARDEPEKATRIEAQIRARRGSDPAVPPA